MDKTEFTKRYNDLKSQIAQLKKEYIESNISFPVGTKVKVTSPNGKARIGVVTDNIVDDYDVRPYVMLLTKEGEVSKRRIIVYSDDIVERI